MNYLLDCLCFAPSDQSHVLLVGGSYTGDLYIIDVSNPSDPSLMKSLTCGHSDVVRSLYWDNQVQSSYYFVLSLVFLGQTKTSTTHIYICICVCFPSCMLFSYYIECALNSTVRKFSPYLFPHNSGESLFFLEYIISSMYVMSVSLYECISVSLYVMSVSFSYAVS